MSTVQEIKKSMIAVKEKETALQDLNSTSKVSIWNLLFYIVAVCALDLRKYFDEHRNYVDNRLANQKAGTLSWYRSKALEYQYGFNLIQDTDRFDNTGATENDIEASKIIKYATANEGEVRGSIVIKVATEINGKLSTITPEQEEAITSFYNDESKGIAFAGDEVVIINQKADKLVLNIRIYRNPLLLTSDGVSTRYGNKPVEEALQEFMKELPFNGELIIQDLVDKLQVVEGVEIAHVVELKSSFLNPETDLYGTPTTINVSRIPESGYFEIENFDGVSYVVSN